MLEVVIYCGWVASVLAAAAGMISIGVRADREKPRRSTVWDFIARSGYLMIPVIGIGLVIVSLIYSMYPRVMAAWMVWSLVLFACGLMFAIIRLVQAVRMVRYTEAHQASQS